MTMPRNRIRELRTVRAGDLKADPRNWRKHPKAQREALQAMLDRVGWADAVIARETPEGLVLVDGHLRADLDANAEVPVLVVDLDEAEAGQVLATLDPLAAMAEANTEALSKLLQEVTVPIDLGDLFPNLPGLLPELPPAPDDVVEPVADPITKRGDIWQLGRHRLMCGDSVEDFGLLGDVSGGLVLTDPPYGISIVKGHTVGIPGPDTTFAKRGTVGVAGVVPARKYAPVANDDRPFDPGWLLSVGEHQIIFGGQFFASKLRDGTAWLCWDKGVEHPSFSAFELAWTSFAGHSRLYRHKWSGMVREGERGVELADRIHPTQKPVGLFESILADIGADFELVLDPFVGSGTTIIAAERQNRTCYAMEIDPGYVDAAVKRWEAYTGGKGILT